MGILTVFKKQAFAFENGISIKWESGPPHAAFCSKWESRLLFYNKNNKDVNTNFYNLYIFVNLEHLCVKALSYNEKQQGMNTKTFTICPFSINF